MSGKFLFAVWFFLGLGIVGLADAAECIAPAEQHKPRPCPLIYPTPAQCYAIANPGDGWDFTCRTIGKIMHEIGVVSEPVQVTNMPGEVGSVAFSHVVNDRNTDEELIVAASTETIMRLAQKKYGEMTHDQVRFLGAIGADPGVLVVAKDSPFKSLEELLEAFNSDPGSIVFTGGSAVGGYDHMKVLLTLLRISFTRQDLVKYKSFERSIDAIKHVIDGRAQVMTGGLSEVTGSLYSGEVRALAVFSENRVPGFEDIPTAMEQGIRLEAANWFGFYVPKGISDAAYDRWSNALERIVSTDEWAEAMAANGLKPFNKIGSDFQRYVNREMLELDAMSWELGITR